MDNSLNQRNVGIHDIAVAAFYASMTLPAAVAAMRAGAAVGVSKAIFDNTIDRIVYAHSALGHLAKIEKRAYDALMAQYKLSLACLGIKYSPI